MKNNKTALWFGFLGVLAVSLLFHHANLLQTFNHWTLDHQFSALRKAGPAPADKLDVVIVGIDEASFRSYREPLTLWHPHFARFLQAMAVSRPVALGIDMVFPDKSYDFLVPGYDLPLLRALQSIRGKTALALAQTVDERGELRPLFAPIISFAGKDAIALPLVQSDSDGRVRTFLPSIKTEKVSLPTLSGRLADKLGYPAKAGLTNYTIGEPFDYIPFHQVLAWHEQGNHEQLRKLFSSKAVFLGAVLPLEDRHRIPVNLAAWEPDNRNLPGVLIHAQSLRTLAHGGTIQPLSALFVSLSLAIAALLWWIKQPLRLGLPVLITGLVIMTLLSTQGLKQGWYLPLASISFALMLAWLARLAYEGILTALEKRRLNNSFGGYVSPNVMQEIIAGNIHPNMQGERARVCVLFSDIRNFTQRSEHQPPEAIIELLNDYFDEMTEAIHEHGGTVDKFIGDGLMAFFGAPNKSSNPAQDAFDSARQMIERLKGLNARLAEKNVEPVEIGIGLHIGEAVVGHVGSRDRHEYTVIGDTVNSTSRLESLTKGLGYPILVSTDMAQALGQPDNLTDLGEQAVKGRAAIHVYGWKPAMS